MKKIGKRMLSLLLCIALVGGVLSVSVAAEAAPYRYVALGDSCSMGYILNDFDWSHNHKDKENGASAFANFANMMRYLKDTWHLQNVDGTDLSLTGCRPTEFRAILDTEYFARSCDGNEKTDLNSCDHHLDQYFASWSGNESYEQLHNKYVETIASADLITFDMIMADTATLVAGLVGNAEYQYGYASYSELLKAEGCEFLGGSVEALRASLEAILGDAAAQLTGLVDSMLCAYAADVINFTKSVELIYDLNPDVNLIVVGPSNVFEGIWMDVGGIVIPFGDFYGVLLEFLTSYMITGTYSWRYRFADCSGGVETLREALAKGETEEYSYMVDQILQNSIGSKYKKNYSAEQIEEMKERIVYACGLKKISLDVYLNGEGNANLALLGDESATEEDYEALCVAVMEGLDHAAGNHPDKVGYQQKFEAIKRAFLSPVAANGAYLTRILDGTVSIVNNTVLLLIETVLNVIRTLLGIPAKLL